jgi:hypothetical protein
MNIKTNATVAGIRRMVAKALLAGMAAGAFMLANPVKTQAQEFAVGVRAGAPFHGERRFEFDQRQEFLRREEFARRGAFLRHEERLRAQRFHGYR